MKKYALFSLVLISAFMSCKKSNSSSNNPHMNANIGGTNKTFNLAPPVAAKESSNGYYSLTITGVANASTGESMILTIIADKPIVAGTYGDTDIDFDVSATYFLSMSSQFIGGNSVASEAESQSITLKNHFKLVISSIDDKAVKGTFSGDLYADSDPSTTPKSLTNGDFYATFQQ